MCLHNISWTTGLIILLIKKEKGFQKVCVTKVIKYS